MRRLRVACVLRSGGDYDVADVVALRKGVSAHLPYVEFVCLSDVGMPCASIPLRHDWPGWWSKMEAFRPDIEGDLLLLDLDTVIVGELKEIAAVGRLVMLSDFYHPEHAASGVMYLPEANRAAIWEPWIADPEDHMARCQNWSAVGIRGDGRFLDELLGDQVARWQNVLPGQIVSYKVHVRPHGKIPEGARAVCFHGLPRPRDVPHWRGSERAAS